MASLSAERWFTRFLAEIGLRDETPSGRIVGMHAFCHTLITRANDLNVMDATVITGHAGEESTVVRGYQGELAIDFQNCEHQHVLFNLSGSNTPPLAA